MRYLIFIISIWLIYRISKSLLRQKQAKQPKSNKNTPLKNTVRCAHCNLHIPESEAILGNGHSYCCEKHKQEHSETDHID